MSLIKPVLKSVKPVRDGCTCIRNDKVIALNWFTYPKTFESLDMLPFFKFIMSCFIYFDNSKPLLIFQARFILPCSVAQMCYMAVKSK